MQIHLRMHLYVCACNDFWFSYDSLILLFGFAMSINVLELKLSKLMRIFCLTSTSCIYIHMYAHMCILVYACGHTQFISIVCLLMDNWKFDFFWLKCSHFWWLFQNSKNFIISNWKQQQQYFLRKLEISRSSQQRAINAEKMWLNFMCYFSPLAALSCYFQ